LIKVFGLVIKEAEFDITETFNFYGSSNCCVLLSCFYQSCNSGVKKNQEKKKGFTRINAIENDLECSRLKKLKLTGVLII